VGSLLDTAGHCTKLATLSVGPPGASIAPPMNRRTFVTGLGAVLAAPLGAGAQTSAKAARVGILSAGTSNLRTAPSIQGFYNRMGDLGWIENENLFLEFRSADGNVERLPRLAEDLAHTVDVMIALGNEFTLKAAKQTTTVTLTLLVVDDEEDAADSLASISARVMPSPSSLTAQ
jgi:hypothetical protein